MTFFGSNPGEDPWKRRGEDDASIATATLPAAIPLPWPSATAPLGYLICDGSAVPPNCPELTAAYGANLPNLKGCVIVGYDAAQAEFNTLLASGGAKTVALSEAQLAVHDHDDAGHTHFHFHTLAIETDGSHTHTIGDGTAGNVVGFRTDAAANGHVAGGLERETYSDIDSGGSHSHGGTTLDDATGGVANIGDAGSGQAHDNLQPYRVFNYIVRAG